MGTNHEGEIRGSVNSLLQTVHNDISISIQEEVYQIVICVTSIILMIEKILFTE